jgi:hypothetical protein
MNDHTDRSASDSEEIMGLRETINQKKGLTTAIAVVIMVGAIAFLAYQMFNTGANASSESMQAFYTTDDGKSFFQADSSNLSPFMHEGKEAFQAHMFTCDDGKTLFVGYMSRLPADALAKVRAAQGGSPEEYDLALSQAFAVGEIRRPGDTEWVKRGTPAAAKVARPPCPNGGELKAIF